MRKKDKRARRGVLVLLLAVLAGAALLVSAWARDGTPNRPGAESRSAVPSPPAATVTSGGTTDAVRALASLTVLPDRPDVPGYQRGCGPGQACSFGPAWTDDSTAPDSHNGCGTRNDVLREQLIDPVFAAESGCVVLAGTLRDPYTGTVIAFTTADAAAVQIDHIYPLARAFDMGAAGWTQQQRTAFANDTQLELLAVDGRANQSKSDSGPAEWLPPDPEETCEYVDRYIAIAAAYHLAITAAEHDTMADALTGCR